MATKYKFWWRPLVEKALREYPRMRQRKAELQGTSLTPNYNPMPSGNSVARTTENLAMNNLPEDEEKWLTAIEKAILEVSEQADGKSCLALISCVYFKKTHTVSGAAIQCHVSESTAKRRIGRFIWTVGKYKGLV